MSSLTRCNYCTLQGIRTRAEKTDMRVTLLQNKVGGTDVFVHPKGIVVHRGAGEQKHYQHLYWEAWLMAIPKYCCC